MHKNTSIFLEGNYSNVNRAVPPVDLGDQFKFKNRNCLATKLYKYCFAYEYLNPSLRSDRIDECLITYTYWQDKVTTSFKLKILK